MTTDLRWLTQIPASTTQEHVPLSADLAEAPLLEILVAAGHPGYCCRRTPTGDAVAALVEKVERLIAERAAVRAALVDSGTEPVTEDMGRLAALVAAQLADEVAAIARLDQEVERLTAERAALTAPAEGVDVEEVLRWVAVRADVLAVPRHTWTCGQRCDSEDLAERLANVAPALARALMAERAHVRRLEAQEQRLMAEAEELRLTLAAPAVKP